MKTVYLLNSKLYDMKIDDDILSIRTVSQLFKFLDKDKTPRPDKSVLTPMPHTTKLCYNPDDMDKLIEQTRMKIEKIKNYDYGLYVIAIIQMTTGCRISEVLSIRTKDIMKNGTGVLRAKKGSNDRFFNWYFAFDYFQRNRKNLMGPFEQYTRFYVYKRYKQFGITHQFKENGKRAVTHIFRHLALTEAQHAFNDKELSSRLSGHKNKSNLKYYDHNQKE